MTFQRPAIQTPGCCDDYWWPTDKPTNGAGARGTVGIIAQFAAPDKAGESLV